MNALAQDQDVRKWKISRLEGGSALRTDEVIGVGGDPLVGFSYVLIGDGLEFGVRVVETSRVVEVFPHEGAQNTTLAFRTESGSLYQLEPVS